MGRAMFRLDLPSSRWVLIADGDVSREVAIVPNFVISSFVVSNLVYIELCSQVKSRKKAGSTASSRI
jgi:hypothetical protein